MQDQETIILRGDRVLTDPTDETGGWIKNGAVVVKGNTVHEIGAYAELAPRHPGAQVVGDGSQIVMPGIIDAHSHGHGLSRIQAGVFFTFLENMILDWPWRVSLPSDLAAALTAVRHPAPGFHDHPPLRLGTIPDRAPSRRGKRRSAPIWRPASVSPTRRRFAT